MLYIAFTYSPVEVEFLTVPESHGLIRLDAYNLNSTNRITQMMIILAAGRRLVVVKDITEAQSC